MQYKGFLLVVTDIAKSRRFYEDLFGFSLLQDNDGNMIFTDGLVLQAASYWREFLGRELLPKNHHSELYFETEDLQAFVEKLERYYPEVEYVNRRMKHSWGQEVVRFYDYDGNLIEVGTPVSSQ